MSIRSRFVSAVLPCEVCSQKGKPAAPVAYKLVLFAAGRDQSGLTLVEVLVAAAIAAALFGVITLAILTQMQATKRIENGLRYREMANRINYLLAIEGSEASDLDYPPYLTGSGVPSACSSAYPIAAVNGNLFRLEIPRPELVYGDPANVTQVFYYNGQAGDLIRCGPDSQENGVIDHGFNSATNAYSPSPKARVVSRSTTMTIAACDGTSGATDRQVPYRLAFAGSGYLPDCSVVRAKTIFTCNPPLPTASSNVVFTASISGDEMNVTSVASGKKLVDGLIITGSGVQPGTVIADSGGNSLAGVYKIVPSYSASLSSRSMTASAQIGDCR